MFNRNPKKNTRFAIYAGNPGFPAWLSAPILSGMSKPRRSAMPMMQRIGILPTADIPPS